MATETRSAGTHADDSGTGTLTWSNPGNAASSNNSYATVSGGPGAISHYHKSTNFGYSAIGDSDTLTQLELRVERKRTGGSTNVKDDKVYLVIGGVIQTGTNYADGTTVYPTSDTYKTYTITSGLPTVAQLKNSGFGFVISCRDFGGFAWGADLDHTEAIATYTPVVAYTATAACTAGHATAAASCTFAPKCTGSAAPTAAHATCAASMVFSASVSLGSAAPTAPHATGAASMTYTPPVFTAAAACTAGHATAAALASSIYHASAAVIAPRATCAAAMVYGDPVYSAAAPMTTRPATCVAVGQSWRRGAWRYQRLTLHKS